jgi:hypothetical protein
MAAYAVDGEGDAMTRALTQEVDTSKDDTKGFVVSWRERGLVGSGAGVDSR